VIRSSLLFTGNGLGNHTAWLLPDRNMRAMAS
jgi:hypothetical protein